MIHVPMGQTRITTRSLRPCGNRRARPIVLAEFGYGGQGLPTFPQWLIDGTRPSRLAWFLKERIPSTGLLARHAQGAGVARQADKRASLPDT